MTFEVQFLWTIFSTFLLIHTIFLGLILQNAFKDNLFFYYNLPCFISSCIGLFLILPWYGTYKRNADVYDLRISQVRSSEPANWDLVAGIGQKFSDGEDVEVDGKSMKMSLLGRKLRNRNSIPILVIVFSAVYLLVIISSGPGVNI